MRRRNKEMAERNDKLDQLSEQLNENILAVKGTLELLDASITEDDLRKLLLKSVERMDLIQELSNEMFITLNNCVEKINELKK
jgi:hypothetical protein